jgi:hypothetical protein
MIGVANTVANKANTLNGVFANVRRTPPMNVRQCSLFAEMFAWQLGQYCPIFG